MAPASVLLGSTVKALTNTSTVGQEKMFSIHRLIGAHTISRRIHKTNGHARKEERMVNCVLTVLPLCPPASAPTEPKRQQNKAIACFPPIPSWYGETKDSLVGLR